MLCVFSSISSLGVMDLLNDVLIACRQSDHTVVLRPAGAIYVKDNFHRLGGSISIIDSTAGKNGGALLLSSSGVAGDGSGCLWGSIRYSFSWNLDTKFCLHAAGGIYVEESFTNSGGSIKISGSSAKEYGGAVLMSSSWGLWQDFAMAAGSGRSTLGSEMEKN